MPIEPPRSQRKRSPRPTKTGRHYPAQSEARKKLWQNPAYREKCIAARARSDAERRANPQKYTRVGVPDGMRKAEATKAWDAARSLADAFVTTWEASGIVAKVTVPDSDEEQAKACLREACVLALGPSDKRTKLSAANTILKFTMARPTVTTSTEITSAEDWLKAATTHHRQPPLLTTDAQVIQ